MTMYSCAYNLVYNNLITVLIDETWLSVSNIVLSNEHQRTASSMRTIEEPSIKYVSETEGIFGRLATIHVTTNW